MSNKAHSIGFGTSIVIEDVPIKLQTSYDDTTLSIIVESCDFDLVKEVKSRFNDLDIIVPEGGSPLKVAKFSGAISKSDSSKNLSPTGAYRLISFNGEMQNISIPIPIISDINIDRAYFYYQYLSAKSTKTATSFNGQVIFLGCQLSIKPKTDLAVALKGVKLTSAYFLSNNASIIYFDFSGVINIGKIIKALFNVTTPHLTIDVASAGFFRIAKKNTTTIPKNGDTPPITDQGITYLDALSQIAKLQGKTLPPTDSNITQLMPSSFPLGEDQATSKIGIKISPDNIDTDFTSQFTEAFTGDNVKGICFWVMVDFTTIKLFNSLFQVGYSKTEVSSLVLYGFRTENTDDQNTPKTSAYFYAQLPPITLFGFLTFGGLENRQGILFKYTSNKNQYELNGSISFKAFNKTFLFDGDLLVNDDKLLAVLGLRIGSEENSISKPLGMTGINFAELYLCVNKTFAKSAQTNPTKPAIKSKLDLAIGGFIDFTFKTGTKIQLNGNIVFEDSKPRLVLVSLDATPMLTLNDFVKEIIQEPWQWVDDVAKQIGFISGTMYYLSTEGVSSPDTYTFIYDNPLKLIDATGTAITTQTNALTVFKPGYHLKTELVLFEKYVFDIGLDVVTGNSDKSKNGISLSGKYGGAFDKNTGQVTPFTTITAFFISLDSPELSISTIKSPHFKIAIKDLKLFNTSIGLFSAEYASGIFSGVYSHTSPSFGFSWQWTTGTNSGGFSITKIDGIESKELDAITDMVKKLNKMSGKGGCGSVVSSMFGELQSTFTPALQTGKSPSDNGDGTMNTPLQIDYKFTVAGATIVSDSIKMTLNVEIPKSFAGLPGAIIDTLTSNMGDIIEQLLSSPAVYKAIALEMAKKGAAKLAAKMLCKAAEDLAEELAEELAEALAEGLIDAALEGLLELGAVLTGVLAAGIAGAIGGLLNILKAAWDAIKSIFTGGDSDKKKAQDKLDSIKKPVQQLMNSLNSSLDKMASNIQIQSLKASLDDTGNYNLNWDFPTKADLGSNGILEYKLEFLDGAIGTQGTASPIAPIGFEFMKTTSYKKAWSNMRQVDNNFQMNASIQTSITGYNFMSEDAEKNLDATIKTLDSIGDHLDGAVDFNTQLKNFVAKMKGYNKNGLTSKVVFATLNSNNNQFVIGKSVLGINTIIK